MATIPSISMIPSGYKQNKVYSVLPTNGDGDLDFARTSVATRINQKGLIEEMASGVPRLDYSNGSCPSLLLEPQSTNLYLNSEIIVTQDVSTSATDYTVTFYGIGTITFSGSYSGSLVGSDASTRVVLTFTATSGTLTSTVSGSVTQGQIEALVYSTSYIKTEGSTVTRVADTASKSGLENHINSEEGVLYFEGSALANESSSKRFSLSDGTGVNRVLVFVQNSILFVNVNNPSSQSLMSYTMSNITQFFKMAFKYKENDFALWINGTEIATDNNGATFSLNTLTDLRFDGGGGSNQFYGNCKDLRVYKKALTDAELTSLTTL